MWGIELEVLLFFGLASFRVTRLIVFDKITEFFRAPFFDIVTEGEESFFVPKKTGLKKWIGGLLDCYWCTGFWVSLFLLSLVKIMPEIGEPVIVLFAIAGLASLLESINSKLLGD
jgi:hypothetical protein